MFLSNYEVESTLKNKSPKKEDDWLHFEWNIRIKNKTSGKEIEIPYKCGVGLLDKSKPYKSLVILPDAKRDGFKSVEGITLFQITELNKKHRGKWDYLQYPPRTPDAIEVFDSLKSDASTIVYMPTFKEWCSELGYDDDSIKAKAVFESVYEQTAVLKSFMGMNDFNEMINTDFEELANTPVPEGSDLQP